MSSSIDTLGCRFFMMKLNGLVNPWCMMRLVSLLMDYLKQFKLITLPDLYSQQLNDAKYSTSKDKISNGLPYKQEFLKNKGIYLSEGKPILSASWKKYKGWLFQTS